MDIASLLNSAPTTTSQSEKTPEILNRLLQSGGLDAQVIKVDKSGALLSTRLGEILGKNALDLKTGDSVRIRLETGDKNPVLKVSRPIVPAILLSAAKHKALYQALRADQAYTAIVVRHQPGDSKIQIGNTQFSIAYQTGLKAGQLVTLALRNKINAIELKPVNSEQVLKSALAKLLPQQTNPDMRTALSQLVRFLRPDARVAGNEKLVLNTPTATNAANAMEKPTVAENRVLSSKTTPSNPTIGERALMPLSARLGLLLDAIPSITAINSRVIQQWIAHLGLVKPIDSNTSSPVLNPLSVLQQLPDTEATLKQLIQLFFRSRAPVSSNTDQSGNDPEATRNDQSSGLIKEILKLIEQSLNHQLFQKVNARHQQELQQAVSLNLTIPFSDRESVNDLHLKIRQQDREASSEKQCWDIHLSFEFGDLGLISSHINMDGNLLSTSFWSVLAETKQKIDLAIPEFKQLLSNSGFITGQFNSFAGIPQQDDKYDLSSYPDALLDIKV